ncbi:MAG: transposase [Dechloromonas sp.]|nr:transposase [Dechloromonas sp.]
MNFSSIFPVDRSNLLHPLLSDCLVYRKTIMAGWVMEEFAGAALGDERPNQRLVKLATRFADKPTASIPGACTD